MPNKQNLISKEKTQKQNRVWIRIANTCNNKCIFCLDSNWQNGTFPSEAKVKKQILDWYKKWYENRIIISWWEASVSPKFIEYIKFAKDNWYDRVQTITNGLKYWNKEFVDWVISAWLEEITFSFHWHNAKLHDYLVWTPWSFEKALNWLIYIKKTYPQIILNIDIVVNKINITFLPHIIKFFIKLWILEFDILQIIPFGRAFDENKNKLFYNIWDNIKYLQETWALSRIPNMYMWTNRFEAQSFEWYEDLIQDPRKIKNEVMWEWRKYFDSFIKEKNWRKPYCFGEKCSYCFLNQYCLDYIKNKWKKNFDIKVKKIVINWKTIEELDKLKWVNLILRWEEFPSEVYEKFGESWADFKKYISSIKSREIINLPKCLGWSWIFETYEDMMENYWLEDYTDKYIKNLYRKKSLRCTKCKYNKQCEWIHINFTRAYWFKVLEPII